MLPAAGGTGPLLSLTRDGQPVSTQTRTVKGIAYAVFDAAAGSYVAAYPPGPPRPSTGSATEAAGGSAADKAAKTNPAVVQVLPRSVTAPTFPRVKRSGSRLRPGGGRTFALMFRLPRTAGVALTFRNAKGKVVRTIKAPRHAKGTVLRLRWDGRDTRGRYVANGSYRFTLTASAAHYKKTAHGSVRIVGSPAPKAQRRAVGSVPPLSGAARTAAMARLAAHLRVAAPSALCSLAY
jgi:hypothetical protein